MDNNSYLNNIESGAPTAPNPPTDPSTPTTPAKPNKPNAVAIAIICAALGLVIGAAIVFAIFKFTGAPQNCPEKECPTCQSLKTDGLDGVNYGFLQLESASDNIIYSPLSIRNGLSLLSAGANGATKTEIDKVITDATLPVYQNIPDTLSLANAAFIRDTYKDSVLPTYVDKVQSNLGGEVIYDPFQSTENMNNWVKQKTFGLINNIGIDVNQDTELVLANALAIQMDWQLKFKSNDTHGRSFYQKDGSEMTATTMFLETKSNHTKYYVDDNVTAFTLPLDSTSNDINLEFVAIMPNSDIDGFISNVDQATINSITDNLAPASEPKDGVELYIPKFKFDYELKFQPDLEALGIKKAFNRGEADFSNMATDPLYVGQAVHKANIDFSEDGIKAAAITVFGMDLAAPYQEEEPQPIVIKFDHPFLFLIRDVDNDTIWFTGAVYQPNSWSDEEDDYRVRY